MQAGHRSTRQPASTTNKRSIESNVLVDDGAIVVLGGLLQDEYAGNQEKVPGAGRHAGARQPVQERDAQPQEDQPDGVPAAGGGARRGAERRAVARPLRPDARASSRTRSRADSVVVPINAAPVLPPLPPCRRGPGPFRPCRRAGSGRAARCRAAAPPATRAATPRALRPTMRYPLPYAFARSQQLLLEDDGQQLTLWHAAAPAPPRLERGDAQVPRAQRCSSSTPPRWRSASAPPTRRASRARPRW